jgi:hypothetical protein
MSAPADVPVRARGTERPPRLWPKIVLVSLALVGLGAAIVRYSLHEDDPPPKQFVPYDTPAVPKAKTKAKAKNKGKAEVPPKGQTTTKP